MEVFSPGSAKKEAYFAKLAGAFPGVDLAGIELGSMMFFFANNILEAIGAHFGRYGISQARYGVLLMLYLDTEVEWTPAELADAGNISRATMTGLLDRLEKQDLILRMPRAGDRRSITIRLSDEGRRFVKKVFPDHFNRLAEAMSDLSQRERQSLVKLMPRVLGCFARLTADLKDT